MPCVTRNLLYQAAMHCGEENGVKQSTKRFRRVVYFSFRTIRKFSHIKPPEFETMYTLPTKYFQF